MVFSDLLFLFRFLPIILLIYFVTPHKFRNAVLFFTSLVFYGWGEPIYVLLMLFSTFVDFLHGKMVYKYKQQGNNKKAKIFVASSVIINLSLLGFFKYTDFFIASLNNTFGLSIGFLNIALPIGISFYTFQTMSYTLDIYMNDQVPQNNIISFGTYVAMFPQLIAGPIVQYKSVAKELVERHENFDDFAYGVKRFILGFGKKILLANNVGAIWSSIKDTGGQDMSVLLAWTGILCFSLQIYYDFSGYSDMAIGLGRMFGFKFPENFNYPYTSKSITDFWRRWHISLSTWFKEYVYIPLGGNRKGIARQIFNIFIVWTLTGIWHGANTNFLLWGVYFAILLIIEKVFLLKILDKCYEPARILYTFFLVVIGWVIFEFESLSGISTYLGYMFGVSGCEISNEYSWYVVVNNMILIFIAFLGATSIPKRLYWKISNVITFKGSDYIKMIVNNIGFIVIFIIGMAYLVDGSYNPFLYFRF